MLMISVRRPPAPGDSALTGGWSEYGPIRYDEWGNKFVAAFGGERQPAPDRLVGA